MSILSLWFGPLFAFYGLAEKLCLPNLQDEIITAMNRHFRESNSFITCWAIGQCNKRTYENSPLRKYAARGYNMVLSYNPDKKVLNFI
jgi:hypothetical protein